ncbi:hypothetical protein AURDEDRAFT_165693 [Auricularia subglabra TFB-10046 SS5]|nr:hypothetical protein AURDEDRAFT_165693 [Auricularia subglabra TFB-10046 SS5]
MAKDTSRPLDSGDHHGTPPRKQRVASAMARIAALPAPASAKPEKPKPTKAEEELELALQRAFDKVTQLVKAETGRAKMSPDMKALLEWLHAHIDPTGGSLPEEDGNEEDVESSGGMVGEDIIGAGNMVDDDDMIGSDIMSTDMFGANNPVAVDNELVGQDLLDHLGIDEATLLRLANGVVHDYPNADSVSWLPTDIVLIVASALKKDRVDPRAVVYIKIQSVSQPILDQVDGILDVYFPHDVMVICVLKDGTVLRFLARAAQDLARRFRD